jgi:hypothetical protein
MNAGLTNLDTLKRHLLSPGLVRDKQFDAQIIAIGLGVAGMFERFCDRVFTYGSATQQTHARRSHISLSQYPITSVESVRTLGPDDEVWTTHGDEPERIVYEAGLVFFTTELGDHRTTLEVSYTGGYWWETSEPEDGVSIAPTDARSLPADIRAAFLLQCETIWSQRDKLGTGIVEKPEQQSAMQSMDLLPLVKTVLRPHVRIALLA